MCIRDRGASAGSADGTTGEASTGTGEGTAAGTGDGTAGEATADGADDGTTGEALSLIHIYTCMADRTLCRQIPDMVMPGAGTCPCLLYTSRCV